MREAIARRSAPLAVAALAVGLHITMTVGGTGSQLRISPTDLIAPLFALAAAYAWWRRGELPRWRVSHLAAWIGAVTAWILVALVVGWFYTGEWSRWAVLNKGAGWLLVVAHLAAGLYLGSMGRGARDLFWRAFIVTGWAAAAYGAAAHWLYVYGGPGHPRAQGWFENPNAYGILAVAVLLTQLTIGVRRELLPRALHLAGYVVLSVAIVGSESRSAWLGAAAALLALPILRPRLRREALLVLALGSAGLAALAYGPGVAVNAYAWLRDVPAAEFPGSRDLLGRYAARAESVQDFGVQARVQMLHTSLAYWRERPLVGIGPDSFRWRSRREGVNPHGYVLHNTPVWVLTEMGLIGVVLLGAFYCRCVAACADRELSGTHAAGVLLVLIATAGASIGTEILYQRYLWILLGLALATDRPPAGVRAGQ